jgi:hypothetical protein
VILLLIATLVADWRFEGFASDPDRPGPVQRAQRPADPQPGPPPVPPPPAPEAPGEADKPPMTAPPRPLVPRPAPRKPRTIRVEVSPQPRSPSLAHRGGQVRGDADPGRPRRGVAYRNVSLTAARPRFLVRVRKLILARGFCQCF